MTEYSFSREQIVAAIQEYKGPKWDQHRATWKSHHWQKYAFEYDGMFYPPKPIFQILKDSKNIQNSACRQNLRAQGFMIVGIAPIKELDDTIKQHCPTCECASA